jgi:ectoine hydroxylase-related dioxygenase (phytanoyl-CoA dioxygenase family)
MTHDEQKAFFEDQGYLVVEGVLSPGELRACKEEIERLHHVARDMEAAQDPGLRNFQREPYAKGANRGELPVLRKIEQTREYSSLFRDLARHPNLIAPVRNLIGPDLLLFRSTLMLKPAFHGSAHSLHQDSAYWPMEPPTLVTVSIALSDSSAGNGCIQVIPKSHTWGMQKWGQIARESGDRLTDRGDIDTSGLMDVPLKAGTALMFHSLTVHGSGANTSPNERHTALYAYFPPTVRYIGRGEDRARTFPVVAGLGGREEVTLTAQAEPEAIRGR